MSGLLRNAGGAWVVFGGLQSLWIWNYAVQFMFSEEQTIQLFLGALFCILLGIAMLWFSHFWRRSDLNEYEPPSIFTKLVMVVSGLVIAVVTLSAAILFVPSAISGILYRKGGGMWLDGWEGIALYLLPDAALAAAIGFAVLSLSTLASARNNLKNIASPTGINVSDYDKGIKAAAFLALVSFVLATVATLTGDLDPPLTPLWQMLPLVIKAIAVGFLAGLFVFGAIFLLALSVGKRSEEKG